MAINTDAVQRLYVAYYNRPADPAGLAYWEGQLGSTAATQAQLTTLAASGFIGSAEYAALYAGQTNTQIVNSLYVNLFGRAAEAAGLAHWTARLQAGTETFASIALQLTYSAQGTDVTAIANKLSAATAFTTALNLPAEIAGYSGTAAAASARSWLATVTDVAATLTAATAGVDTAVSAAVAAGTGGGGDSTAPTLSSSTPADNATAVAVGNNLVMTFSEAIALGTGNIVLKKTSDSSTIETFNVATSVGDAGGTVTASGTGITINPGVNLSAGTEYYVTVAATAVKDTAGNPYAGISSTTALSFTTTTSTVGNTVVLTAGVDIPVLTANDDTINTNAPNQLTAADTVAAGDGFDTLSITPTIDTALTLDDAIFTNVTGIDKIVILTSGTGAQTITTGAEFNGAFDAAAAGANLQTTSTTGAMTINMSAVTGAATLTAISTASIAGNNITTGSGVTTVIASSTTGAMTINSAAAVVATVTATTTTGAVTVTTGAGADSVTLTTGDTAGNVIIAGAGNDTITILNSGTAASTSGNTITGGLGADTITLTTDASKNIIVIGNTDSGITVAAADRITNFLAATDDLKMGTVASNGVNYVEAGAAVADFAAALTAANNALNGTVLYSFQWVVGDAGYLFKDTGVDGTADQVVVLVGIVDTTISAADIIA